MEGNLGESKKLVNHQAVSIHKYFYPSKYFVHEDMSLDKLLLSLLLQFIFYISPRTSVLLYELNVTARVLPYKTGYAIRRYDTQVIYTYWDFGVQIKH